MEIDLSDIKIQPLDNGPFVVKGGVKILDGKGITLESRERCYLCRCGLSTETPFCNGAHEGKFKSEVRS